MGDLISRSALMEAIKDRQKCFWDSEEINDEYCNIITLVNDMPTVEAVPVNRLAVVKVNLKHYLNTNEENGVVYFPKFIIEKLIRVVE